MKPYARVRDYCHGTRGLLVVAAVAFVAAVIWAKARDPFRRIEFSFQASGAGTASGSVVLPRHQEQFPVVVFLHGFGRTLLTDGDDLRTFAELGLAAVDLEYDHTNQAIFDAQMQAFLEFISRQRWSKKAAVAWVANSLGAQRSLSFILRHPESQPQLIVRLAGGWVPELDAISEPTNQSHTFPLRCPFLLLHGENDEDFPVNEVTRLANLLRKKGVPTTLTILPDRPHNFGSDWHLVSRLTAEYCKSTLNPQSPLVEASQNCIKPHLGYFVPVLMFSGIWLFLTMRRMFGRRERVQLTRPEKALRWLAVLLALWALVTSGIHLIPPHFNISDKALAVARKFLLQPKAHSDFEFLAAQPVWHGQKLKTLLTHVELAGYNRELINWKLEDGMYRDYVLSPIIEPSTLNSQLSTRLDWRRPLWEEFYPRIRRESSPEDAARIVVRHLRERVTIANVPNPPRDVPAIWLRQITDQTGFDIIYVAALRSVGVPARLNLQHQAEFWDGAKWGNAPRPSVVSW